MKDTIELNPSVDCKEVIPQVAVETLRSKKTKGYFGDKDFVVLAGGGFACFKRVKEVGLDTFLQDYNIQREELTVIEVQKIIEVILDRIEEENGEIDSILILSAFQSAMANMLLGKLTEPTEFLSIFCEIFISMIIREDANEALTSMFRDISTETFNKSIEEFSKRYVKENFMVLIENCSNGEIQIEELIKKLQDTLNKK
ncbi:hypothetical protein [Thomasclavelia cocleata]|uniref:hypothetical protein n=1 Tax=Thomasclavelia cocleata TaxID=69824 RepID=UPI00255A995B|nr:hypothetical protein [Thomasclavelia cocleata]